MPLPVFTFHFLLLLLLLLLVVQATPHVCVHDEFARSVTKVRAPPSDGVAARRNAATETAPIRIVPLYHASDGGTDISIEDDMNEDKKGVVEAAVDLALVRLSSLLRVTPVSGNLYAYRLCTAWWDDDVGNHPYHPP